MFGFAKETRETGKGYRKFFGRLVSGCGVRPAAGQESFGWAIERAGASRGSRSTVSSETPLSACAWGDPA